MEEQAQAEAAANLERDDVQAARETLLYYRDFLLKDAETRLGFQHDFAQSALKGLILINGGAIVALLALVSQPALEVDRSQLLAAFASYAGGLVFTITGYIAAYLSQAWLMRGAILSSSKLHAQAIGFEEERDSGPDEKKGERAIAIGIGSATLSLAGFIGGSMMALSSML